MDAEIITERRIESAARHARESNRHLFVAGYQAAKVYGLYQEAATAEIARRAGVREESVRHWVYAYRCFAGMFQVDLDFARLFRREFTMTHFQEMQEAAEKYDIPPADQMKIFYDLWGHKKGGDRWSVVSLQMLIDAYLVERKKKKQSAVNWEYHFKRLKKPLEILKSFDGELPAPVRRWIAEGLRLFE